MNDLSNQSVPFDYNALSVEQRIKSQNAAREIQERVTKTSKIVVEIGDRLTEVKESLGHGKFTNWVGGVLGWPIRTAQRFMQVSAYVKSANIGAVDTIQASALALLASPRMPEAVRSEMHARAEAGETVTHLDVKAALGKSAKLALLNAGQNAIEGEVIESTELSNVSATQPSVTKPPSTPAEVMRAVKDGDPEPWASFNAEVMDEVKTIEQATRRLKRLLGFEGPEGSNTSNKMYAYFIQREQTIDAIYSGLHWLKKNLPAKAANDPPGFINAETVKMRERVKKGSAA